jgi:hypothetical protein
MPNPENLIGKGFKKGQSGNPNGRPKGTLNASTIIRKWLEASEKIKNPASGKVEVLTQMDIITLSQIQKARKGDTSAFNALLDRVYGKPKQPLDIDHTTDGESLNATNTPDLSKLTDAELRTLARLQRKSRTRKA